MTSLETCKSMFKNNPQYSLMKKRKNDENESTVELIFQSLMNGDVTRFRYNLFLIDSAIHIKEFSDSDVLYEYTVNHNSPEINKVINMIKRECKKNGIEYYKNSFGIDNYFVSIGDKIKFRFICKIK